MDQFGNTIFKARKSKAGNVSGGSSRASCISTCCKKGHEINPDFKIGCMCAVVPFYPYSCNPEDMITSVQSMHERFLFMDVHARGHYGNYAFKEWERTGDGPVMENGDLDILKEGKVDYIGFSYYMSNTVKADAEESGAN